MKVTKNEMLQTGLDVWKAYDQKFSIRKVAEILGVSHSLIHFHFGNTKEFESAVLQHGIDKDDSELVDLLLAFNHPILRFSETKPL